MKLKISSLLAAMQLAFLFITNAQEMASFTLNGRFKNLPNRTKIYLCTQEKDTVSRTFSEGEFFKLNGQLPLNGRFHFIYFDTMITTVPTNAIFLERRVMEVDGLVGSANVQVKGSSGHSDYRLLMNTLTVTDSALRKNPEWLTRQKDKGEAVVQDSINQILREKVYQWVAKNRHSLYASYVINSDTYGGVEKRKRDYESLADEVKKSYYGSLLEKKITQMVSAEKIREGSIMPDFKVSSVHENQNFSILELAKKGKVTLIDFWASWCKPCRAETPNLKKVYETFHDKGFNIIGVSNDTRESDWKKALSEEKTSWFHGRDNIEKAMFGLFGIGSIPAYMLIDSHGKLLAFDCSVSTIPSFGGRLRGDALYTKIEELLK